MGVDKIEKRLPEEIIAYIDEEAIRAGISRQEALSRLIHAVTAQRNEKETEHLRQEVKALSKVLAMKDDEISYLRSELSAVHTGLSKMADTLASGNCKDGFEQRIHSVEERISELHGISTDLRQVLESARYPIYERHIPLIIVGILAGLLVLYLILMKI